MLAQDDTVRGPNKKIWPFYSQSRTYFLNLLHGDRDEQIFNAVLPDIAVSCSHNPPLIDQGSSAEVEAGGVLTLNIRSIFLSIVAYHNVICKWKSVCVCSYLQRHLPGPGMRDSLLTIHNPGITGNNRRDGRNATAFRIKKHLLI